MRLLNETVQSVSHLCEIAQAALLQALGKNGFRAGGSCGCVGCMVVFLLLFETLSPVDCCDLGSRSFLRLAIGYCSKLGSCLLNMRYSAWLRAISKPAFRRNATVYPYPPKATGVSAGPNRRAAIRSVKRLGSSSGCQGEPRNCIASPQQDTCVASVRHEQEGRCTCGAIQH